MSIQVIQIVLRSKEEDDEKQEDGIEFDIVDEIVDIVVVNDDITDIVVVDDDDIVDVIVVDTIDIDIDVVRYQVAYISVVFMFAIDITDQLIVII